MIDELVVSIVPILLESIASDSSSILRDSQRFPDRMLEILWDSFHFRNIWACSDCFESAASITSDWCDILRDFQGFFRDPERFSWQGCRGILLGFSTTMQGIYWRFSGRRVRQRDPRCCSRCCRINCCCSCCCCCVCCCCCCCVGRATAMAAAGGSRWTTRGNPATPGCRSNSGRIPTPPSTSRRSGASANTWSASSAAAPAPGTNQSRINHQESWINSPSTQAGPTDGADRPIPEMRSNHQTNPRQLLQLLLEHYRGYNNSNLR